MSLLIKLGNFFFRYNKIKMLVFDMAGTTINEHGIVYNTLYDTIKHFNLDVRKSEIEDWHGRNKYEVLQYYLDKDLESSWVKNNHQYGLSNHSPFSFVENVIGKKKLYIFDKFDEMLLENYSYGNSVSLMNPEIPDRFNRLREKEIKIALNTGYGIDVQKLLINELKMDRFIDDYISSEEVVVGRPKPYMINKLMERQNIMNPLSVIKIGDTNNDMMEGINAGCIASIGVLSGVENKIQLKCADHIINNVMDIE